MNITLGEVGTYINGYAFKPSDWGTSGLPIIRIQNLTNQNTVPNYFDGPYNSKFEVNKGDILIAWSGSLGIHIWQKNKALLNQHIFRVEFNKCDIDKMYFYYAVKYNIHKMLHLTHGATMRHIIKSDFEQIIIPYPRLEIQVKISKVLNYLDQNIINYKNILIKLELLIKSRFVEMFGDPNASRTKYKLVPIHMVTDCMVPGRDKPKLPTQLIKTLPCGTHFRFTSLTSSIVNPSPSFDLFVYPLIFKSLIVIQGISPVKLLGLSLPGTIQSVTI